MKLELLNDHFKPKPLPTRPQELLEYDDLPLDKKRKLGNDFWRQPVVKDYSDSKFRIFQQFLADEIFLKNSLKDAESEGSTLAIVKIKERLQEFKEWKHDNWEDIKQWCKQK